MSFDDTDRKLLRLNYFMTCLVLGVTIGTSCASRATAYTLGDRAVPRMQIETKSDNTVKYQFKDAKIRIGIIDTGYDGTLLEKQVPLCPTGSYDFTNDKPGVAAGQNIHGTVMADIIARNLDGADYCLVIYQVEDAESGYASILNMVRALDMASTSKLTAINISLTGSQSSFIERKLLERLAATGTQIFAAAGNDNRDLDEACNAYPACYSIKNLHAVGALNPDLQSKAAYSNYGTKVELWFMGAYNFQGRWVHGTSNASPSALSDYIRSLQVR